MTHQEILTKAIEKAVAGGYTFEDYSDDLTFDIWEDTPNHYAIEQAEDGLDIERIIFNHDFAKALWGEENQYPETLFTLSKLISKDPQLPKWKLHLMRMVIADDPIAYLGKHI